MVQGENSMSKNQRAYIAQTHSSMIDLAKPIVRKTLKIPGVDKITLGKIDKAARSAHGKFRVKLTNKPGAILLQVRGNLFIQLIWVYTDSIPSVRKLLEELIKKEGIQIQSGDK
jgi:hypothetical protein